MHRSSLVIGVRATTLLIGLVLLAGCASYHAENVGFAEIVSLFGPAEVR